MVPERRVTCTLGAAGVAEMGTFPQRGWLRRRFLLHNEVRRPVTSRHVCLFITQHTVPCYLPTYLPR